MGKRLVNYKAKETQAAVGVSIGTTTFWAIL